MDNPVAEKKEVSDKDFSKNVCYIKHFVVFLQPISYNYE